MTDLYKLTYTEAAEPAIEEIMARCSLSKAAATDLFKNTLLYNVVVEQIANQAEFLMEA